MSSISHVSSMVTDTTKTKSSTSTPFAIDFLLRTAFLESKEYHHKYLVANRQLLVDFVDKHEHSLPSVFAESFESLIRNCIDFESIHEKYLLELEEALEESNKKTITYKKYCLEICYFMINLFSSSSFTQFRQSVMQNANHLTNIIQESKEIQRPEVFETILQFMRSLLSMKHFIPFAKDLEMIVNQLQSEDPSPPLALAVKKLSEYASYFQTCLDGSDGEWKCLYDSFNEYEEAKKLKN